MKIAPRPTKQAARIMFGLALGVAALCDAQTAVPAPAPSSPPDKTIERIRTEDAGTRIDEVRVGGETQSITVQPKVGDKMPAYEVKPSDTRRGGAPSPSTGDTTGSRVWNVLKF